MSRTILLARALEAYVDATTDDEAQEHEDQLTPDGKCPLHKAGDCLLCAAREALNDHSEDLKTLRQTIAAATLEPDLDKALVPIQATLGQDDGGPAGVFFSGNNGETWPTLTPEERHEVLLDYIASELTYIGLGDGA